MMISTKVGRRTAAAGVAALAAATAASVALLPSAAGASGGAGPARSNFISLKPTHGSLDDNPVAAYRTTTACPTADRAYAQIALGDEQGNFIDSLSAGFTPTDTPPSGQLDAGSLQAQVLGHDLTSGYYRVDLLCYNDDFTEVVSADKTFIQLIINQNRFKVTPRFAPTSASATG